MICSHCMQDAVEPATMLNWSSGAQFWLCHPSCYLLVLVGRHGMPCAECSVGASEAQE